MIPCFVDSLDPFKIDDFATIFRLARQHVLIEGDKPLTRESLVDAVKTGQSFVGFDVLGDTTGFRFESVSVFDDGFGSNPNHYGVRVISPLPARIVVFLNGERFDEMDGSKSLEMDLSKPGAYRVEVYLDQLGPPFDKMPWIISKPIYVH